MGVLRSSSLGRLASAVRRVSLWGRRAGTIIERGHAPMEMLESRLLLADVGGTIAASTTWSDTAQPYRITSDLTINAGVTLTIASGVTVTHVNGKDATINGTLILSNNANWTCDGYDYANVFVNGTMTMQAGSKLEIGSDACLRVNGTMTVNSAQYIKLYNYDPSGISVYGSLSITSTPVSGSYTGSYPDTTYIDVYSGGTFNATGSSLLVDRVLYANNSKGTLTSNTMPQLQLASATPTVTGNTFTGADPLYCPSGSFAALRDSNTFGPAGTATVHLTGGTIAQNLTLGVNGSVSTYYLEGDTTLAAGTTLSIAGGAKVVQALGADMTVSGTLSLAANAEWGTDGGGYGNIFVNGSMTMQAGSRLEVGRYASLRVNGTMTVSSAQYIKFYNYDDSGINVYGSLSVTNTPLSSSYTGSYPDPIYIDVYSGGTFNATGSSLQVNRISYANGATGTLTNSTMPQLQLASTTPTVTGNTFTGADPLYCPSGSFAGIRDSNIFGPAGTATVHLTGGTIGQNLTLGVNGSVSTYYVEGDTTLATNATLTISSGAKVVQALGADMTISGSLSLASNAEWGTDGGSYGNIFVNGSMTMQAGSRLEVGRYASLRVNGAMTASNAQYIKFYNYDDSGISVYGSLSVTNTPLSSSYTGSYPDPIYIDVYSGGTFNATGSSLQVNRISYANGAAGSLTNNTMPQLQLASATPTVTGNTFTGADPLYCPSNVYATIAQSNTFGPAGTAKVHLTGGTIAQNLTLGINGSVNTYSLEGDTRTLAGTSVTVGSGAKIVQAAGADMTIAGSLSLASNAEWTNDGSGYENIFVDGSMTMQAGSRLEIGTSAYLRVNGTMTANSAQYIKFYNYDSSGISVYGSLSITSTPLSSSYTGSYSDPMYIDVYSGGTFNATGSSLQVNRISYADGSSGRLAACTIGNELNLFSDGVTVDGSTFATTTVVDTVPNNVADLSDNTFASGTTMINVLGGTIDRSGTWPKIANVAAYNLAGSVLLAAGATLNVGAAALIKSTYGAELTVNGTLSANNATFGEPAGYGSSFTVHSGGRLNLSGGTRLVNWPATFDAASLGTIQGAAFDANSRLTLRSDSVTVNASTFAGDWPVEVVPVAVPELADNTFSNAGKATIAVLAGTVDRNQTWGPITNVTGYSLQGNVEVKQGSTLTLAAGTVLSAATELTIAVSGTLSAAGVTFGDLGGSAGTLEVYTSGTLNLSANSKLVQWAVRYETQSHGSLQATSFDRWSMLHLDSPNISVGSCTFQASVPVEAHPLAVPDLADNTFANPSTVLILERSVDRAITWPKISSVAAYELTGGLTIASGGSLTVAAGVLVTVEPGVGVQILGTLSAAGTTFGNSPDSPSAFNVAAGGALNLGNGTSLVSWDIHYAAGSAGSVQGTTLDENSRLYLLSPDVSIAASTFRSAEPVQTMLALVPQLADNTFNSAGTATIELVGQTLATSTTWSAIGSARRFLLRDGSLTLSPGAALTVTAGAQAVLPASGQVLVQGTLTSNGGSFGEPGGTPIAMMAVAGSTLTLGAGTQIWQCGVSFAEGSNGTVEAASFDPASSLALFSSSVKVNASTFQSTGPVQTWATFVPELVDNTFNSVGTATITLQGEVDANVTWNTMGTARRYWLANGLTIRSGRTLTLGAGIEVASSSGGASGGTSSGGDSGSSIDVSGTLSGTGVAFDLHSIRVRNGGQIALSGGRIDAGSVQLDGGSSGSVQNAAISASITTSGAGVALAGNTFSSTTPLTVPADAVAGYVAGNSFNAISAATATVLGGSLSADGIWPAKGSLQQYEIASSVTVPAGRTLSITSGVTLAGSSSSLMVDGALSMTGATLSAVSIHARHGSTVTVAGATLLSGGIYYAPGSAGSVQNSTLSAAVVSANSTGATLSGNTVSGTDSLSVLPDAVAVTVQNNTFAAAQTTTLHVLPGTLSANAAWNTKAHLTRYSLEASVTVAAGRMLTIPAGVTLGGSSSPASLEVSGTLAATSVILDGWALSIRGLNGGTLNITGSTIRNGAITVEAGSAGSITGNTFTDGVIRLNAAGATVSGNTFGGTDNVHAAPDLVFPAVRDNSFTAGWPVTLHVLGGAVGSSAAWGVKGSLARYAIDGGVMVAAGRTLSLSPGVTLSFDNWGSTLSVDGTLSAGDATLCGDRPSVQVRGGGQLTLNAASLYGGMISFASGSTGSVQNTAFTDTALYLNTTAVPVSGNTFHGTDPLHALPASIVTIVNANTFISDYPATVYVLPGALSQNTTWAVKQAVNNYALEGGLLVPAGVTLTLAANIGLRSCSYGSSLTIDGVVAGTSITAQISQTTVRPGGRLSLSNSTLDSGVIDYNAGSSGGITGSTVHSARLRLSEPTIEVSGNSFTGTDNVTALPGRVAAIVQANTFSSPGSATVYILSGTLGQSAAWGIKQAVHTYALTGSLDVPAGVSLTLGNGTTLAGEWENGIDSLATLNIAGTISAPSTVIRSVEVNLLGSSAGQIQDSQLLLSPVHVLGSATLSGNTFTSRTPLYAPAQRIAQLTSANTFASDGPAVITITGGTPDPDTTWAKAGSVNTYAVGPNGPYGFAGVYSFRNLTIGDDVQITSTGISQLVLSVSQTLTLGDNAVIRVRNGYYAQAPAAALAAMTAADITSTGSAIGGGRVYPGLFGQGGAGGRGGDAATIGGGGGAGGFGGGNGGAGGNGATAGEANGGNGGMPLGISGAFGGSGGEALSIGYAGSLGGGGGGNGGAGSLAWDNGAGGGGGAGGYGGGILSLVAGTITYDMANPPRLLVSGQAGGQGAGNAEDGQAGAGGMLIIECGSYAPDQTQWDLGQNPWGSHELLSINGGHGAVAGAPQQVFINPYSGTSPQNAITASGSTVLTCQTPQTVSLVSISDFGVVRLASGGSTLLSTQGLSITGNGILDLNDNDLIVRATAASRQAMLDLVTALVARARNANGIGAWTGSGITSGSARMLATTGLAVVLNGQGGTTLFDQFAGQAVGPNDVLVKYTFNGDADLDGRITAEDYVAIDRAYLTGTGVSYASGDFDYSGTIDGDDYFLIDGAFLGQGQVLSPSAPAIAAVNPPSTALAASSLQSSPSKASNNALLLSSGQMCQAVVPPSRPTLFCRQPIEPERVFDFLVRWAEMQDDRPIL